jgi:hypothetical protein
MKKPIALLEPALIVYVAFVFVQSLFFKFSNSPETQHIFGTLDAWGASLGFPGLFAPGAIFSAHVIGGVELVASVSLLASLAPKLKALRAPAALLGVGVMTGAIFFHLFTPLGVNVQGDGGLLFGMACGVWLACAVLAIRNRASLLRLLPSGSAAPLIR